MSEQSTWKGIIVLGPGRSGTSLLMRILHGFGMRVSEKLLAAGPGNKDGFYEDIDILGIQRDLIAEFAPHPLLPLSDGWLRTDAAEKAFQKLNAILKKRIGDREPVWGFKDPRTASLLPLWNRIFSKPGALPVYLLALRDPRAVTYSLARQMGTETSVSELLWLHRVTDALHYTGGDCFILHYEDWFNEPVVQARGLLEYTGLDQTYAGSIEEDLQSWIKPKLNHYGSERRQVLNPYVRKLYEILRCCKGSDFNSEGLMELVAESREAIRAFKGLNPGLKKNGIGANDIPLELQKGVAASMQQITSHKEEEKNRALLEAESRIATLEKDKYLAIKEREDTLVEVTSRIATLEQEKCLAIEEHAQALMEAESRIATLEQEKNLVIEELKQEIADLAQDLSDLTGVNNRQLKEIQKLHKAAEVLQLKYKHKKVNVVAAKGGKDNSKLIEDLRSNIKGLQLKNEQLRTSYSFLLGQVFVNAVAKPGVATLLLPYRFFKIVFQYLFWGRRKMKAS